MSIKGDPRYHIMEYYLIFFNTLRPRQNGCYFANDIFRGIFLNENFQISNTILLKYVSYEVIDNEPFIDSDNGLVWNRCQAIIWTNAGIILIGPLVTNFSEILIKILSFSFKKMHFKVLSGKRRPFRLGLNVLKCVRSSNVIILAYHCIDKFLNDR